MDGGAGDDFYLVSAADLPASLTDPAGDDVLEVDGTGGADAFQFDNGSVTSSGRKLTPTGVESVTLDGENGSDSYTLPSFASLTGEVSIADSGSNGTDGVAFDCSTGAKVNASGDAISDGTRTVGFGGIETTPSCIAAPPPAPAPTSAPGVGDDLATALVADVSNPKVGDQVTYRATVSDGSGGGAKKVILTVALPSQVTVLSTSADRGPGRCDGTGTLSCNLDWLLVGVQGHVTILVRVDQPGQLVARASVQQANPDPSTGNDSASVTLNVAGPAAAPAPNAAAPVRTVARVRHNVIVGTGAGEQLLGTATADVIHGRGGDDVIRGLAGDDVLYGGAGRDRIVAGDGDDVVFAADGQRDRVDCGAGSDRVVADRRDVLVGCEDVRRV
jgi:uncharacterized repeat protein (TIGR01451 family)